MCCGFKPHIRLIHELLFSVWVFFSCMCTVPRDSGVIFNAGVVKRCTLSNGINNSIGNFILDQLFFSKSSSWYFKKTKLHRHNALISFPYYHKKRIHSNKTNGITIFIKKNRINGGCLSPTQHCFV